MLNSVFKKQAEILLRVLPHVMTQKEFALKGGTAINLFVRQFPRLSVDIDLTYVPIENRETSLDNIHACLTNAARKITRFVQGAKVLPRKDNKGRMTTFFVQTPEAQVKIEPNLVIRGTVFPCERRELTLNAERVLKIAGYNPYIKAQTLSFPDLYGGKICAALDRQHPRDLFDVMLLLDKEGVSDATRKAFLVYLISHDRPMAELLNPTRKDIRSLFQTDFLGMVSDYEIVEKNNWLQPEEPFLRDVTTPLKLIQTREKLINLLQKDFTNSERQFLLSFKQGTPEWNLLGLSGVEKLPAPQWKLLNIKKMRRRDHAETLKKLEAVLGL